MKTTFAADISTPGEARTYLASQLRSARLPAGVLLDKVVLVASELVTNAVQAGATAIEIGVRVTERSLDLVVIDDADGWPTPTSAAADDTAGRGLRIVEQLADVWDVAARSKGKAITARFHRSDPHPE